jgi:probable DNA metabolism protein
VEKTPGREGFPEAWHAALLYELSVEAFDALVHARMSELPIEAEMGRFAGKVISAARQGAELAGAAPEQNPRWAALPEARRGAEQAAVDRSDPDVRGVLEAAYKVRREIDRLRGLLRFRPCPRRGVSGGDNPGPGGPVYVARCSPDHYILPGLAEHFTRRFGECPWAVVDEKRNLILAREPGGEARLFPAHSGGRSPDGGGLEDEVEDLWRNYHRSVNNPDRNNPALQRQFMPRRYWKYLPELQ